mmetsp:Transcript_81563/g.231141  ORF Transcript_81563/g.231141 Transcript_81563/m.231141 type:complete len:460 (-) Transcript_81563:293-1672(-)
MAAFPMVLPPTVPGLAGAIRGRHAQPPGLPPPTPTEAVSVQPQPRPMSINDSPAFIPMPGWAGTETPNPSVSFTPGLSSSAGAPGLSSGAGAPNPGGTAGMTAGNRRRLRQRQRSKEAKLAAQAAKLAAAQQESVPMDTMDGDAARDGGAAEGVAAGLPEQIHAGEGSVTLCWDHLRQDLEEGLACAIKDTKDLRYQQDGTPSGAHSDFDGKAAACAVRATAAEQFAAAWGRLRKEFEVQQLIWDSVHQVKDQLGGAPEKKALEAELRKKLGAALDAERASPQEALSMVTSVLRDYKLENLLNKTTWKAALDVVDAEQTRARQHALAGQLEACSGSSADMSNILSELDHSLLQTVYHVLPLPQDIADLLMGEELKRKAPTRLPTTNLADKVMQGRGKARSDRSSEASENGVWVGRTYKGTGIGRRRLARSWSRSSRSSGSTRKSNSSLASVQEGRACNF